VKYRVGIEKVTFSLLRTMMRGCHMEERLGTGWQRPSIGMSPSHFVTRSTGFFMVLSVAK
jgi:hypothetical protein